MRNEERGTMDEWTKREYGKRGRTDRDRTKDNGQQSQSSDGHDTGSVATSKGTRERERKRKRKAIGRQGQSYRTRSREQAREQMNAMYRGRLKRIALNPANRAVEEVIPGDSLASNIFFLRCFKSSEGRKGLT